jgi:hypothetical protein
MWRESFTKPGTWMVIVILLVSLLLLMSRACAGTLRLGDWA